MKEFEFTKGEWYIENKKEQNEYGTFCIDISSDFVSEFATIWSFGEKDKEADATAKLMLSAPNLLYALIDLVEMVENLPENKSILTSLYNAKKAIDKATK